MKVPRTTSSEFDWRPVGESTFVGGKDKGDFARQYLDINREAGIITLRTLVPGLFHACPFEELTLRKDGTSSTTSGYQP